MHENFKMAQADAGEIDDRDSYESEAAAGIFSASLYPAITEWPNSTVQSNA